MPKEFEEESSPKMHPFLAQMLKNKSMNLDPKAFLAMVPKSGPQMIVLPMNKHGDGFILNHYEEK
jgi:alpha-L-fucosidase